jgi:Uma2 family endonuclease
MSTVCLDTEILTIPAWIRDLASFRRWAVSEDAPEKCPLFYLAGEVWIDVSKEQIFSHIWLKQKFYQVLGVLSERKKLGKFFPDGLSLTNEEADLSGNPDGTFVSNASFRAERVRLVEVAESGQVEMEGSPDMVLEVVSDSSESKDTEILRDLYWKAGIREYWLVDARGDRLAFDIFRRTRRGYLATPKTGGWMKSVVFGQSFRLTRRTDELGHPEFTLRVR